jgi:hypothetical protein
MTSFSDYVQKQAMSPGELPVVHTTKYYRLPAIQASNMLHAATCKVFKEPLLYFFYGRPAYRDDSQIMPTRDIGFYPICFVFRGSGIGSKAKRVFPFDTGAGQSGLYEPAIKKGVAVSDYQLLAAVESARKLVGGFFDTDEKYLSNNPKSGLVFSSTEAPAQSYYQLINGGGDPECDDRYSAVEIQLGSNIDIRDDIMAVVLPTSFLDDDQLAETILKTWRAEPLTYDAVIGMRPLEFHGAIRLLIRQFYQRQGFV